MYGNIIWPIFILFFVLINGQNDDDKDLFEEINQPIRSSKSSFDAHFQRGRCPDRFYQIGDECLFFASNGKKYSWQKAERFCARLSNQQTSFASGKPTKGIRQLILNTPEKTKILEALYREYDEVNFLVRLPSDYNKLNRCHDGKEDFWPQFCTNSDNKNGTCFELVELGSQHVCLRQIDCNKRLSRLACEFTLKGSSEITSSKFRHCPKKRGLRHRLSIWAWLLVAVGAMLLLLLILGGVLTLIRNSKKNSTQIRKSITETHQTTEPMLVQAVPANLSEEQPLKRVVPLITTTTVEPNEIGSNV